MVQRRTHHSIHLCDFESKETLYKLAKKRLSWHCEMMEKIVEMEGTLREMASECHKYIKNEARMVESFEKEGTYQYTLAFRSEEEEEGNRGEKEEKREEEERHDKVEETEEGGNIVESDEIKEGDLVEIVGGTKFSCDFGAAKVLDVTPKMVVVRDSEGNEFKKLLKYVRVVQK